MNAEAFRAACKEADKEIVKIARLHLKAIYDKMQKEGKDTCTVSRTLVEFVDHNKHL